MAFPYNNNKEFSILIIYNQIIVYKIVCYGVPIQLIQYIH